MKSRDKLADEISDLCEQAGCNPKIRKVHREQYVHKRWNPHPPNRFVDWWNSGGWRATEEKTNRSWVGVEARIAFNCEAAREVYRELKTVGVI